MKAREEKREGRVKSLPHWQCFVKVLLVTVERGDCWLWWWRRWCWRVVVVVLLLLDDDDRFALPDSGFLTLFHFQFLSDLNNHWQAKQNETQRTGSKSRSRKNLQKHHDITSQTQHTGVLLYFAITDLDDRRGLNDKQRKKDKMLLEGKAIRGREREEALWRNTKKKLKKTLCFVCVLVWRTLVFLLFASYSTKLCLHFTLSLSFYISLSLLLYISHSFVLPLSLSKGENCQTPELSWGRQTKRSLFYRFYAQTGFFMADVLN